MPPRRAVTPDSFRNNYRIIRWSLALGSWVGLFVGVTRIAISSHALGRSSHNPSPPNPCHAVNPCHAPRLCSDGARSAAVTCTPCDLELQIMKNRNQNQEKRIFDDSGVLNIGGTRLSPARLELDFIEKTNETHKKCTLVWSRCFGFWTLFWQP